MRKLRIVDVYLQNFRSFVLGDFILTPTTGLKFLGGENTLEPRLGANGAGKTTVWEAVVWCLYGKSTRGARTSNVIAWGQKEVAVSVQVEINGVVHCVTRTGPPERIEISSLSSDHCTQAQVDELIGLSRERFLHTVVFGQGRPLFPDLSVSERGELFDEVLNLDVWTRCSEAATLRTKQLSESLGGLKGELGYLSGQLSTIRPDSYFCERITLWETSQYQEIRSLETQSEQWCAALKTEIADIELHASRWEMEKAARLEKLQALQVSWAAEMGEKLERLGADIEAGEAQVEEVRKLFPAPQNEDELVDVQKELDEAEAALRCAQRDHARDDAERLSLAQQKEQLSVAGVCPTCKQLLSNSGRVQKVAEISASIEVLAPRIAAAVMKANAASILVQSLREKQTQLLIKKTSYRSTLRNLESELLMLSSGVKQREEEAAQVLRALDEDANPYKESFNQLEKETNPHSAEIARAKGRINPFEFSLAEAKKAENPHLAVREEARLLREKMESKKAALTVSVQQAQGELTAVEFWKTGFKRIRLYFVNQILAALQIEILSAINSLGLNGWSVKLSTESETKSGTIKLGVQIRVQSAKGDEGEWETWSGGESQRLRLAMGMGLAALIQRAAGVWFDVEVWDEPSAWLSEMGIEDLLEALRYRADSHHKQIWLVDHRALTYSGFREIWCVRKNESGSQIIKVSEAAS